MSKIKTREIAEKSIKTLDKAAVAGERMKNAYIRTKKEAQGTADPDQGSASEYAGDKVERATENLARKTGQGAQKAVQRGRESFKKQREKVAQKKRQSASHPDTTSEEPLCPGQLENVTVPEDRLRRTVQEHHYWEANQVPEQMEPQRKFAKERMESIRQRNTAPDSVAPESTGPVTSRKLPNRSGNIQNPGIKSKTFVEKAPLSTERQMTEASSWRTTRSVRKAPIKNTEHTVKTARKSIKATDKTVKTAQNFSKATVKTAHQTSKVAIKTAEAAKTARWTAQTTGKAVKASAHAAHTAVKAMGTAVKATVKATASAVKAKVAATKGLIAAIAAGGGVAVAAVVIVCMVGLLVGSCFGILFSAEDTGAGQSVQTAVTEINAEYQNQLEAIKAGSVYDLLEMRGSRATWREVLAVYAVKMGGGQEVTTMDNSKKAILREIFWAMNAVTWNVQSETRDLSNGASGTTPQTVQVLHITVTHRTAQEMASAYGFTSQQNAQLSELLAEDNRGLWSAALKGIGAGDGDLVMVALSQLGNTGETYWTWEGFDHPVAWCACFVSWCADQCGYVDSGVIPNFTLCTPGVTWFQTRNLWQPNTYEPQPGEIIFFDWDKDTIGQDGLADHVGIVEKVEDGLIYTIEGNSGDLCEENHYAVGNYQILGYGTPAY